MKRLLDVSASILGLVFLSPVLITVLAAIWLQDHNSPFYIAPRVGKDGKLFNMVKLRSMRVGADKTGVSSTSAQDSRITPIGHFVRRYKLDEVIQLWNVLKGDMSLVGPRPNVKSEVDLYTSVEKDLLSVKPGITDFASIVFSDEGDILKDSKDPDLDYNQLIRPWKSRLGLVYIQHPSIVYDVSLIALTVLNVVSRPAALRSIARLLEILGVDEQLLSAAKRNQPLTPYPPPGADSIVGTSN